MRHAITVALSALLMSEPTTPYERSGYAPPHIIPPRRGKGKGFKQHARAEARRNRRKR